MSIFDVIRYPNIDIFDKESLHQLPRPLLEAWAKEITEYVEYPFTLDLKNPKNDFSTIAYNTVITASRGAQPYATGNSQGMLISVFQQRFTILLKKMIADYGTALWISDL